MKGPSPAYDHVLSKVSQQMDASRSVLFKLRRGSSLFPKLSAIPAALAVLAVLSDLGVWAIVLSIAATSALLAGAFVYTLVERRMVASIRVAVSRLSEISDAEREHLLQVWLGQDERPN